MSFGKIRGRSANPFRGIPRERELCDDAHVGRRLSAEEREIAAQLKNEGLSPEELEIARRIRKGRR